MAKGRTYLFTVGYTDSGVGVTREAYPIKRKYKQTVDTQYPKFPDSFELVSASLYWFPWQNLNPTDIDYIPYTVGDEYGWVDDERARPKTIAAPNPNSKRRDGTLGGSRIVYSGQVYEATKYYFYWSDTSLDETKNPYRSDRITKWRKISDTSTNWTQYWYHPLLKRFYTLEESDDVRDLPDPEDFLPTKWDSFTGDAKDLTLSNFTPAQIKLLVSSGTAPDVAKNFIDRFDLAVLERISADPNYGTASAKTSVNTNTIRASAASVFGAAPDLYQNQQKNVYTFATTVYSENNIGLRYAEVVPQNIVARMFQYPSSGNGVSATRLSYGFEFRPNNVSYSNIGSNWTEIERVNNSPVLDFKNFKLMKISFEFVVGNKTNLYDSCEEQLSTLRKMASQPYPVLFEGFDKLFSEHDVYSPSNAGSGKWAIVDMSISSVFRTQPAPGKVDADGSISRATVNMTIQEIPRDTTRIIQFPKLPFQPPPGAPKNDDDGDGALCMRKFTELESIQGLINSQTKRALLSDCAQSGGGKSKLDQRLTDARRGRTTRRNGTIAGI